MGNRKWSSANYEFAAGTLRMYWEDIWPLRGVISVGIFIEKKRRKPGISVTVARIFSEEDQEKLERIAAEEKIRIKIRKI